MGTDEISSAVRELIDRHLPSMDHVQVLLHLHHQRDGGHAEDVARAVELQGAVVAGALRDLASSGLLEQESETGRYRLRPTGPADTLALEELDALYHKRPVTLVRALYDRPATVLRSFSDAFRLRKPGA